MTLDEQSNMLSQSKWATRSSMIFDLKELSEERWNRFVLVYTPLLQAWIRSKGVPSSSRDDVFQDSLIKIYGNIGTFERRKRKGSFRSWLRSITERRAIDCLRKLSKSPGTSSDLLNQVEAAEQKDAEIIDQEQKALERTKARAVDLVRSSTNEKTWEMFWQFTVEGIPSAEIAKQFGTTQANVRVASGRVRGRLKGLLIDDFNEDV